MLKRGVARMTARRAWPRCAWATANRVVLGHVATDATSNEITAIPPWLALRRRHGCIVTIDAMGCQTKIAEHIIEQGGDDVLALKGNQGTLAAEVEEAFIDADVKDYAGVASDSWSNGYDYLIIY